MGVTIMEMEDITKRVEKLLDNENQHLDWLMAKRIQFLNNKYMECDDSIVEMIYTSQRYIDYYSTRFEEYRNLVDKMKKI